jgi:hypothetical protein
MVCRADVLIALAWQDTWQKLPDWVAHFCEPMIRRRFMAGTRSILASPVATDVFLFRGKCNARTLQLPSSRNPLNIVPVSQPAMLNFQVDDLDAVLERLLAVGVAVDSKREVYDYGPFGWFTDPEGNRVELWQPPA